MKLRQLVLVPLLLPPLLNLCVAASHAAGPADEATVRGEAIFKEDCERCTPRDKVLFDENRRGLWDLRCKTWGDNNLLYGKQRQASEAASPFKAFFSVRRHADGDNLHQGRFGARVTTGVGRATGSNHFQKASC